MLAVIVAKLGRLFGDELSPANMIKRKLIAGRLSQRTIDIESPLDRVVDSMSGRLSSGRGSG